MEKIEIKDFTDGTILREADFRQRVDAHDWEQYAGKAVLIQGCSTMLIPTWAFLVVTARLVGHAERIYFGEQKTRIPIHAAAKTSLPA